MNLHLNLMTGTHVLLSQGQQCGRQLNCMTRRWDCFWAHCHCSRLRGTRVRTTSTTLQAVAWVSLEELVPGGGSILASSRPCRTHALDMQNALEGGLTKQARAEERIYHVLRRELHGKCITIVKRTQYLHNSGERQHQRREKQQNPPEQNNQ